MYSHEVQIVLQSVFTFLIVVNVTGNSIVCYVVYRFPYMRTPMNYLIVHLAVSDMLFGMFIFPRRITWTGKYVHPSGLAGDILCKFVTFGNVGWIAACASTYTIIAIAWERYNAVVYPLKRRFSKKTIRCMIVICWIMSCMVCLLETLALEYNPTIKACDYNWTNYGQTWAPKLDSVIWLVCVGNLPFFLMMILYARVIKVLWWPTMPIHVNQRSLLMSRRRITKTVVIVAVIGFICWNPNLIYFTYSQMRPASESPLNDLETILPAFNAITHTLVFLNSAVNPFVYALQYTKFRKCLRRLLTRKRTNISVLGRDNTAMQTDRELKTQNNNNDEKNIEEQTNCNAKQSVDETRK